ncbi:hypothetical protein L0Y69_03620 [bacterium]|nr:hypothetical protein [bacterium]
MDLEGTIRNPGEYLLARARIESELALGILTRARESGDYFREKAAAKLVAYHEEEEKVIRHFVEIKQGYPELTVALEKQKPYLVVLWAEALAQWEEVLRRQNNQEPQ